jgi:hypothetical protein
MMVTEDWMFITNQQMTEKRRWRMREERDSKDKDYDQWRKREMGYEKFDLCIIAKVEILTLVNIIPFLILWFGWNLQIDSQSKFICHQLNTFPEYLEKTELFMTKGERKKRFVFTHMNKVSFLSWRLNSIEFNFRLFQGQTEQIDCELSLTISINCFDKLSFSPIDCISGEDWSLDFVQCSYVKFMKNEMVVLEFSNSWIDRVSMTWILFNIQSSDNRVILFSLLLFSFPSSILSDRWLSWNG